MRWFAIVLLLGVFVVHDTPQWMAAETGYPRNWLFYGLLGLWTATLSAFLAVFLISQKASLWRNLALVALGISIVEGLEMPTCLVAAGVANVNQIPKGVSLCDYVAGFPVGSVIEAIYFLVVIYVCWKSHAT